jgi:hypothetical protein
MTDERRLKAMEKRIEQLDTEVWDLLKVLKDSSGSLHVNAERMEARHCVAWKKRHVFHVKAARRKKK